MVDLTQRPIIICDDEPDLRQTVGEYLTKRGFLVELVEDALALRSLLKGLEKPGAVLLDISMPGEDGLSVLKWLREENQFAVILLTAASDLVDKVVGLEMGADDYITKPVDLRELDARLRAVLRRTMTSGAAKDDLPSEVAFGKYTLDFKKATITDGNGAVIDITAMEFDLLKTFYLNRGQVLNRDQLVELAHSREWDPYDRSIDIRVYRLRQKLEENPSKPTLIRTVRGIGYIFDG